MRRILAPLIALLVLVPASAAQAAWFRADAIDGPADISALGDVDLARDGTGGVVYMKNDGGSPQLFLSRLSGGVFGAPEKLTSGAPVSDATITSVEGGRLVIAWVAGGDVFATSVIGAGAPAAPQQLSTGGGAGGLTADEGIDNVAYVGWAQSGGGGSDVRAARLDGNGWSTIPQALDIDPARPAGDGLSRPRIAVSADGNAVITWGESAADGLNHVYARRLTGLTPSSYPQDLTLADFAGEQGGSADSPDIDIEDDGSFAWVAFRETIGGRSRTFTRRLVGSLFDPPFSIDGGATSSAPRIDFAGKGIGAAVAATADNATFSSYLDKFDKFNPAVRIDQTPSGTDPGPVVATSERGDAYAAWRTGQADGSGAVHVRRKNGEGDWEPEFEASNPDFGAVVPGELEMSSDRLGDVAVAMLAGGAGARRLAVAVYDRPPGAPIVLNSSRYRGRKPLIKWQPGAELWGAQTFTVLIDGKSVGTATGNQFQSRKVLRQGTHRYQILATDRRGQTTKSLVRTFKVDPGLPSLTVRVRHSGRTVRVSSVARDRGPSGLAYVSIDWGDRHGTRNRSGSHRYAKGGKYTITVRAYDRADNVTIKRFTVRVKRSCGRRAASCRSAPARCSWASSTRRPTRSPTGASARRSRRGSPTRGRWWGTGRTCWTWAGSRRAATVRAWRRRRRSSGSSRWCGSSRPVARSSPWTRTIRRSRGRRSRRAR
ncbi:MAG: hypothetical protein QOE28_2103 [Solirubrobacteraceae bacterium]|nr:hypothetical protein [Solirubrobacteraceae bacterium]